MTIEELRDNDWVTGGKAKRDLSLKKKGTINAMLQFNTVRKVSTHMNAGRSNKRMSMYAHLNLHEEAQQMSKVRQSLCLSSEDVKIKIDAEVNDSLDIFRDLTEQLMAFSMRYINNHTP